MCIQWKNYLCRDWNRIITTVFVIQSQTRISHHGSSKEHLTEKSTQANSVKETRIRRFQNMPADNVMTSQRTKWFPLFLKRFSTNRFKTTSCWGMLIRLKSRNSSHSWVEGNQSFCATLFGDGINKTLPVEPKVFWLCYRHSVESRAFSHSWRQEFDCWQEI